jgi:hypothetical protein
MAEESASEKAIKKSAEGIEPPPSRKTTPTLKDGDPLFHELIVVLDEAGVLPHDWVKCNMFDYPDRSDILCNFYVKDPTQDPLDLIDRHVIRSYRITDDGDGRWIVENT